MELLHRSVLLAEAIEALAIQADGIYVDGTYGRGGHAVEILARLGTAGRLWVLDRDPLAILDAERRFANDGRVLVRQAPFSRLLELLNEQGVKTVHGILFDLGVSSPQLDDASRGFSFQNDGPLDMRMDPSRGVSAADWLQTATEAEIISVLRDYGEERFAKRIARAIIQARAVSPITTTHQLAAIISTAIPYREPKQHPATRSFQAIRIRINQELDELSVALEQARRAVIPGGRIVVISFHSLEDRLVKRFFRRHAQADDLPPELPIPASYSQASLRLIGKAKRPSAAEAKNNPRARSAVMRTAERVA